MLSPLGPWDEAPRHLLRDRDGSFGPAYTRRIQAMRIRDHPTAPRSPWQNGHVDRLIGSIRRESLDHFGCVRRGTVATRAAGLSCLLRQIFGGPRSAAASQRSQSSADSITNRPGVGFDEGQDADRGRAAEFLYES